MPLTLLSVTLVLAGGLALINLWLGFRIGQVRHSAGISVGDGGNDLLIRRMRAQANFVENAPFVVILVGLIEFTAGTSIWLWSAAALFLVARIAHALGMDGGAVKTGRAIGTGVTMLLLLALGLWAIALPFVADRYSRPVVVDVTGGKA